jgi:predicted ATPase
MNLEKYEYREDGGWEFNEIDVRRINLFVGATGSGKSRLLNTLSSIGDFAGGAEGVFKAGGWKMQFRDQDKVYKWSCHSIDSPKTGQVVESESLVLAENGVEQEIFARAGADFTYNKAKLPRLSPNTTALYLFREELAVAPIQKWFADIRRRNFYGDDLVQACAIQSMPKNVELASQEEERKLVGQPKGVTLKIPLSLSARLGLLKKAKPQVFFDIANLYRSVFPNIEKCDVVDAIELNIKLPFSDSGQTPIFVIKERHVDKQVMLPEFSSGMQKVLLIITDVLTLPRFGTYLIDEYENSLGVNAIGFLPELLLEYGADNQFFITSHHPYLINNMPVNDWHIFHRKGSKVTIKPGREFAEKFGASKQQAFIQLMNDPFYSEGVE